tara:strand:+ start:289 stop:441 length:153 start_codon:yes stop_codon:yes gene_type:complete
MVSVKKINPKPEASDESLSQSNNQNVSHSNGEAKTASKRRNKSNKRKGIA